MKIEYLKIKSQTSFYSKIKKYKWQIFLLILLGIISIFFILNSSRYMLITVEGIILYGTKILPSLLPFLFVTKILSNFDLIFYLCSKFKFLTKFLFNTSSVSFYIFFMSIISGYPVGAKLTSEFYEKGLINQKDAQKILSFCSTSGPLFVIGSVGVGFFSSTKIGLLLFFVHILSSIINGIIFGHIPFLKIKNHKKTTNKKHKKHLKIQHTFLKNNKGFLKISKKMAKNIKKLSKNNINLFTKHKLTIKNNIFKNKKICTQFSNKSNLKLKNAYLNYNKNNQLKNNIKYYFENNKNKYDDKVDIYEDKKNKYDKKADKKNKLRNELEDKLNNKLEDKNFSLCETLNEKITLNEFQNQSTKTTFSLDECMYNSIRSVLIVGGFVIIFYVFLQIMLDYNILYPLTKSLEFLGLNSFEAQGFSSGLFEITKGISLISKSTNLKLTFILSSFLISFSGISIILQSFAFLNKTKISKKTFIFQKFCHAIISTLLAFFVGLLFL